MRIPGGYRWSSYEEYIYGGRQEIITDTDDTLYCFSKKRAIAAKKYQEFVDAGINGKSPLAKTVGTILGDEAFRKKATGKQRKIAIYLSKTLSGEKNVKVGRIFGITLQAVTNAVRDIEKQREKNRKFSNEITRLKQIIEK